MNQTWTITFSESVENHAGMQIIGNIADTGFTIRELEEFGAYCQHLGAGIEMCDLERNLPENLRPIEAKVLIVRGGARALMGDEFYKLVDEIKLSSDIVDKKAWMKGKVVNKIARWNLCYGDTAQEPDYENKKGRIVAFSSVPMLSKLREKLGFCEKSKNMFAEMNYYYDINKCGIGFHGDSERKLVIGVRVGCTMCLQYQWFYKGLPIGDRIELMLNEGDIYVMSDKAVGTDWKRQIIPTLRHSAGSSKFTTI